MIGDLEDGRAPVIAVPRMLFTAYAHAETQWLESDAAAKQARFWSSYLDDAETVVFPAPDAGWSPATTNLAGRLLSFPNMPLRCVAPEAAASPFAISIATGMRAVNQVLGRHDTVARTMFSGRDVAELDRVVGWLARMAAIRLATPPGESIIDLARRTSLEVVRAFKNSRGFWLWDKRNQGPRTLNFQILYKGGSHTSGRVIETATGPLAFQYHSVPSVSRQPPSVLRLESVAFGLNRLIHPFLCLIARSDPKSHATFRERALVFHDYADRLEIELLADPTSVDFQIVDAVSAALVRTFVEVGRPGDVHYRDIMCPDPTDDQEA